MQHVVSEDLFLVAFLLNLNSKNVCVCVVIIIFFNSHNDVAVCVRFHINTGSKTR